MTTSNSVQLGVNEAAALKAEIGDINTYQQIVQIKVLALKRQVSARVKDAGLDPAVFENYKLVEEGSHTFLVPADTPTPELKTGE